MFLNEINSLKKIEHMYALVKKWNVDMFLYG